VLVLPSSAGEQWWSQQSINTLALSQVTATVLTFSEPATLECVAGTVTFTMHGADLACRWT